MRLMISFPPRILRMRFTGVNNLKGTNAFGDLAKAVEVAKDQVGALVSSGAASEANGEGLGIHFQAGLLANRFQ